MITRNKREMAKKISAGLTLSLMAFFVFSFVQQASAQVNTTDYVSLTTIPGFTEAGRSTNPIEKITNIYGVSIGIAAVLAVVMIIFAGLKYATTEAIDGKSDAKDTWHGAVYGLGLLLASFLLLRTINIDLVNVDLSLGKPQIANGTLLVGGGALADYASNTAKSADAAIASARSIQQELAIEKQKLSAIVDSFQKLTAEKTALGDQTPADRARREAIDKELAELEAKKAAQSTIVDAKTISTQSNVISASALKGNSEVAKALSTGDIELANTLRTSTSEALARQISTLPPGEAQDKAIATKIAFDGISSQQIYMRQSINTVNGAVIQAMSVGTIEGVPQDFNLAYSPAVQESIKSARTTLASKFSATEVQIRAKDPSQVEAFRQQTLAQRNAFDLEVGKKVGCPKGIVVSSDGTVSCK